MSLHNTWCSMERLNETMTGKDISVLQNVLHSDCQKKILKLSNFFPYFQSLKINLKNLITIGRVVGNKSLSI